MKIGEPLIINLACTGAIPKKKHAPHVPTSIEEIVSDIEVAIGLGIQMVHLHARDNEENHSNDPVLYGEIISGIRGLTGGKELIVCVTTSGRFDSEFKSRSKVLDLDGTQKPDMASLTLSSMNFMTSASVNSPPTIQSLAGAMLERGIKAELEVFDLGMANYLNVLASKGLIEPPYYVNVLLGNIAGAQSKLSHLIAILDSLPEKSVVSIAGLGAFQFESNGLGCLLAHGVRTGLEDNVWLDNDKTQPASNALLIERVIKMATAFDRPLYSKGKLRELLGLTP